MAVFIRLSTPSLCCFVIPGESPKPSIDRPTLILVECTGASSTIFPTIFDTSISEVCLAVGLIP